MAQRAAPADHERVACPNCGVKLPFAVMNEHLDRCLAHTPSPEKKRAPPPSPPRPAKTPRVGASRPFAERMRPQTLEEYVGQADIVQGTLLGLLRKGQIPSMVLWGPPGSGKTTLARIVTREANGTRAPPPYRFVEMSATTATVNDVKRVIDEAVRRQQLTAQNTVLFIDEIQRFNRAQQDLFLPALERGHITLLAATTENPSFRLQSALLSRLRVVVLGKLSDDDCFAVLHTALERVRRGEDDVLEAGTYDWIDDDLLRWMAHMADGDARAALHMLELTLAAGDDARDTPRLKASLRRTAQAYGTHTKLMQTALATLTMIPSKSIRGSDPNAALYWLARMVCGGDDPLFIARRLIVCASEDCCSADALQLAVATYRACEIVGLPECGINLSHCVVALAEWPKSTRSYRAWKKVLAHVESDTLHPVPLHIRNAPTKLMKDLGYGAEYRYEPRFAHPVHQEFLPPQLRDTRFLSPPPDDLSILPIPAAQATGPGSCQRRFQVGERSVDLDLLTEWEQIHNDGKPWVGRTRIEALAPPASPPPPPTP